MIGSQLLATMATEKQLQQAVLDLARLRGWIAYHTFDSRRSQPGFPDLVLVRDRIVFVELKSQRGVVTFAQQEWLNRLAAAGSEVHVWRPADWPTIVETLR